MKIVSVNIGTAQRIPGKPSGKSGIFKSPVAGPVLIDDQGLIGDAIINRKHHGGVDQAVYVESLSDLEWWAKELGRDVPAGLFGENMVLDGIENRKVAVGDVFLMGEVQLEVTSPRIPCATFAARMDDKMFVKRFKKAGRPGFYCRVLKAGEIEAGMDVIYRPFEGDRVLVAEIMATYKKILSAEDRLRYLASPLHHKMRQELEEQIS